ncbi:MAG: DUF1700 domain-containing protein [Oscillospiraceae bacterium]
MKKQYIRQVRKDLHIPRSAKAEVVRDLQEIFASAAEHGESEQQVAERLGTPREFADRTAEQFGFDPAARRRRNRLIQIAISLAVAAAAFALYAAAAAQRVPPGAIGQADAMTNIRVEGAGFDVTLCSFSQPGSSRPRLPSSSSSAARSGRWAA